LLLLLFPRNTFILRFYLFQSRVVARCDRAKRNRIAI
jgi:hypothetical protein